MKNRVNLYNMWNYTTINDVNTINFNYVYEYYEK